MRSSRNGSLKAGRRGSDAHAPVILAFLDFAAAAAAEAGIASERIINTMSVDELRGWTASRRQRPPAH
jgi:hypothetical protein